MFHVKHIFKKEIDFSRGKLRSIPRLFITRLFFKSRFSKEKIFYSGFLCWTFERDLPIFDTHPAWQILACLIGPYLLRLLLANRLECTLKEIHEMFHVEHFTY